MPAVLSKLAQITQLAVSTDFRPSLRDVGPALVGTGALFLVIHLYRRQYKLTSTGNGYAPKTAAAKGGNEGKQEARKNKAKVNWAFIKRLWRIVRILIPRVLSAEALYMLLIAASLLARTYADVWMIQTSTGIEA